LAEGSLSQFVQNVEIFQTRLHCFHFIFKKLYISQSSFHLIKNRCDFYHFCNFFTSIFSIFFKSFYFIVYLFLLTPLTPKFTINLFSKSKSQNCNQNQLIFDFEKNYNLRNFTIYEIFTI
jgi:hypothetical protein